MEAKKIITSKIVSSGSKKSPTVTPAKSRQPSIVSRATSKQSHNSTSTFRPEKNFSSTRSSRLIVVKDKIQPEVQRSSQLPSYLRRKRAVTADDKIKLKATEPAGKIMLKKQAQDDKAVMKFPQHNGSKVKLDVLPIAEVNQLNHTLSIDPTSINQIDLGMRASFRPYEGEGSATLEQQVLLQKELELSEAHENRKALQALCDRLVMDCTQKHRQNSELEAVVATKMGTIEELEKDIEKLGQTVENLRLTSSSRDSAARDGLQGMEQKMDDLRKKLSQKSNDLIKSNDKVRTLNACIVELKTELGETGRSLNKKETQVNDLLTKETAKDLMIERQSKEIDDYRQHSEALKQRITLLTQELADKDSLMAALKIEGQGNIQAFQTGLEAHTMPNKSDKQSNDLLLQNGATNWTRVEGFDVIFENVLDKQHQCAEEDQIINDIERNNRKCRAVRDRLLKMLKQLKKENRQMREIIRSNADQNDLPGNNEKTTESNSNLEGQNLKKMCRLFPEEPEL